MHFFSVNIHPCAHTCLLPRPRDPGVGMKLVIILGTNYNNCKLYPSSGRQLLHANTIESSVNKLEVAKEMTIHVLGSRAPPPWMDR